MVHLAARGFKALKQVVKLHYKLGNHNEMLQAYRCGLCPHGRTDERMQPMFSEPIRSQPASEGDRSACGHTQAARLLFITAPVPIHGVELAMDFIMPWRILLFAARWQCVLEHAL